MQSRNFLEADKIQRKIKKLKTKQLSSHKSALKSRQKSDLEILEESHSKEISEFNELWDQKFEQYKEACMQGEKELKDRQKEVLEEEREKLTNSVPVIPKHSSQILNLQKIQDAVIRQKEYREAHTLQVQLDGLVEGNQEKWQEERNDKIQRAISQLVSKQEFEVQNYRKKALSGFNELKKQKASELEALFKRYNNAKQDLLGHQKIENSRLEMTMKVTSDLNTVSKLMTSRSTVLERFTPHASIDGFNS